MHPPAFRSLAARLLLAAALVFPMPLLAQQAEVIRGKIVDPDGAPVEGARVTVTMISGNVNRQARTGNDGRFTVTFPNGDGDYMVAVAAIGYTAKRYEIRRTADEEVLIADARLQRAAAVLDAMKVTAQRERVARGDPTPDASGTELPVDNSALPAADLGDLAAMAATLPGVQLVPGANGDPNGFSVLGLGADQNNTTLNGMSFGGANLPRDANIMTSLVTSPYDVSRGGFSGGQLSLRTRPGSNFSMRGMSLNVDAPQLQWTDRAARALGQQYSNVSLGGMASGALAIDKAFYNVAWQLGRRASDFQSLLNTSPVGLQAAGVAADSVNRFLGIVGGQGIPATIGRIPSSRLSDQGSLFGSIDFAPPTSTSGQAFNLAFNGSWNHQDPLFSSATGLPSSSGERTGLNLGVQGRHTGYLKAVLSETSVGMSGSASRATPFLRLPAGRVRVNSTFDDGTSGVQLLSFGGSPFSSTSQSTSSLAFMNQLSWVSLNARHRVKLTSELRRDAYSQDQTTNQLGTWSYNSLADLAAAQPASFTRQLAARRSGASQMVGALSLGDAWRATRDLQLQYGVRVDGNGFLDAPTLNPELESRFAARNDRAPGRLYVSPRAGFSWTYGSATQIAGFDGAARVPRAVVRGGVGLFQNMPTVQSVGQALDNTGLASAVQQLACVGSATPIPDWSAYAASAGTIPTQCADGSTGSPFASSAPNVTLFARDWAAPRSLRSNLQWSGPVLDNRFVATLEGVYSRNANQGGIVDLNFADSVRFTLPDESGRPVYVDPASIVGATGAISASAGRVSPLYGRVNELRSDLRSESRQLSLRLSPASFSTGLSWSLAYTYGNVRERVRGFGTNTAGDPLAVEWARSPFDSRHQIVYTLGYNFFDAVRLSWYGQFRSGNPFTPTVGSDVNGDGWANDRAFVFDPARTGDPALASAMQSLLANGSSEARACLRRQLNSVAARNSCEGPWTSTATLSLSFNPVKVRMPQRASVSFQLSNPFGAADLLLHGENALRGWGQMATPDPALLYVRGFDPATNRWRYEVNQRFGASDPARSAFRLPVTLTAMMRVDVGPTRERQLLSQQLDRGRRSNGDRIGEPILRLMLGNAGMPNPLATILRQQDSLRLTSAQADSIATLNRWYSVRLDSIWSPVAHYLGTLPDAYDQGAAYDAWLEGRRASVDLLARLAPGVMELLTPEQRRKLPAFIAGYLDPRYLASIRSGTVAFTGGAFVPPGAGGGQVIQTGAAAVGGGGGNVIIIRQ